MKGIIFVEFLEYVEKNFSIEISEQLIESVDVASGAIYTTVGTYDYHEILTLITNLSKITGNPAEKLTRDFGKDLFHKFYTMYTDFFIGINSCFDFLVKVESYIHLEVKKLYPDAELPTFKCTFPKPDCLHMLYQSKRNLSYLAEGLIYGCIHHFNESLSVERRVISNEPLTEMLFIVSPTG